MKHVTVLMLLAVGVLMSCTDGGQPTYPTYVMLAKSEYGFDVHLIYDVTVTVDSVVAVSMSGAATTGPDTVLVGEDFADSLCTVLSTDVGAPMWWAAMYVIPHIPELQLEGGIPCNYSSDPPATSDTLQYVVDLRVNPYDGLIRLAMTGSSTTGPDTVGGGSLQQALGDLVCGPIHQDVNSVIPKSVPEEW